MVLSWIRHKFTCPPRIAGDLGRRETAGKPAGYTKISVQLVLLFCFAGFATVFAHNPALDPPEPLSVPEAWNIITQCTANIDTLLKSNQLREIAYQVADCSPAIRFLQAHLMDQRNLAELKQLEQLFN